MDRLKEKVMISENISKENEDLKNAIDQYKEKDAAAKNMSEESFKSLAEKKEQIKGLESEILFLTDEKSRLEADLEQSNKNQSSLETSMCSRLHFTLKENEKLKTE